MEGQEQARKSKVVTVDSAETWDMLTIQSTDKGCPVVVHFKAAWCIPSVAMNPFFEGLASTYQDVMFLSVDVDDVKEVASKMEITAMPTFLLMREGKKVDKVVGANPDEVKKRIDGFIDSLKSCAE